MDSQSGPDHLCRLRLVCRADATEFAAVGTKAFCPQDRAVELVRAGVRHADDMGSCHTSQFLFGYFLNKSATRVMTPSDHYHEPNQVNGESALLALAILHPSSDCLKYTYRPDKPVKTNE
jgi:hypothetical protein